MLSYIKNYDIYTIRNKLLTLYILNVTDIIFTLILLSTGFFNELNPIMLGIIQNPIGATMLKTILPGILLFFLYRRMQPATNKQLRVSNIAINILIIIYAFINLCHLIWILSIPIFMN